MPRIAESKKAALEKLRSFELTQLKTANIGGDQEAPFEQSFGTLAYSYIRDKAPRLLDYMVGFQLVDRNDDNTKAVGIFGFQVGDQWLYAPCFFLNGDLKGHELLYIKNEDNFVPMKENWINYLLSRRPHILGEGTPENLQQLGVIEPNFRSLQISPRHGKFASAGTPHIPRLNQDLTPMLGWLALTTPDKMEKYAGLNDRLDLLNVLSRDYHLLKAAWDMQTAYPEVREAIRRFYGDDLFHQAALTLRKQAVASDLGVLTADSPIRPATRRVGVLDLPIEPIKQAVEVFVQEDVPTDAPGLTDEEREKLLQDGVLIRDNRDDDSVTLAYDTTSGISLVSPSETQLYQLLVKPGTFKKTLVVLGPHSGRGHEGFAVVADPESGGSWLNIHPSNLFARTEEAGDETTRADFQKWRDGLPNAGSMDVGSTYMLLSPGGSGTCPFTVKSDLGDGVYGVTWHDYAQKSRPDHLPRQPRWEGYEEQYYADAPTIHLKTRFGQRFKSLDNHLYVPTTSKLLKLSGPAKDEQGGPADRSESSPVLPGNNSDLQLQITQKSAELRIFWDHQEPLINGQRYPSEKAARIDLVVRYGLRESLAREMLKIAVNKHPAKFRLKQADPSAALENQMAPAFPQPQYSTEQLMTGNSVQSQMPQTDFMPVPSLSAANTDPSIYDYRTVPDPMAMQAGQQAAQSGQKQVFDTTMISGLLKSVRQDSIIDRYLGDLRTALDRLGRILFLFYWHNEEFEDRYGKGELPELEDTTRNSFEGLGDLVLFLKERTVDPYPSVNQGHPSIDEAARN